MRAAGLALLAVLTIGVVVFVFVELHAATAPVPPASGSTATATTTTPPPGAPVVAAPRMTPPPQSNAAPTADLADPLDHVVQGKTRREWRAYYAAQQRRIGADLDRYQEIIDSSSDGQEHDWAQVKDAHQRVRELREQMRRDLEDLARIENAP